MKVDRPPSTGRSRILAAALRLMAEEGIDSASLRKINQQSGLKNASGVQYHFGNRAGLLEALIEQGMTRVDARRRELLDDLEAAAGVDPRDAVRALVKPLADELSSEEGCHYLLILQQLGTRPLLGALDEGSSQVHPGLRRCTRLLQPTLDTLPDEIRRERAAHLARFMLRALGDQARQRHVGRRPRLSDAIFTSNLVDELVSLLRAPLSPETLALCHRG